MIISLPPYAPLVIGTLAACAWMLYLLSRPREDQK